MTWPSCGLCSRSAALLLAQTDHEAALYGRFGGTQQAIKLLPLPLDLERVGQRPGAWGVAAAGRRGRVVSNLPLPRSNPLAEGTRHLDRRGRAVARRGRNVLIVVGARMGSGTSSRSDTPVSSRRASSASSGLCTAETGSPRMRTPTSFA